MFLWPISGQPFHPECNISSAKLLNISRHLLCTNGQFPTFHGLVSNPHLPQLGVKFHNPAGVPKSNSLLPGKGGCQMPMTSPGMWGEGMLRLQIDQYITQGFVLLAYTINENRSVLIPVSLIAHRFPIH